MKLIIGGAYQGKLEYAEKKYRIENWVDGRKCEEKELFSCAGIHHFHSYIRRMMEEEKELDSLAQKICKENPKLVIVTNELGYGVVPVEAFDRTYREITGRICCQLAEKSEEVVRVVCGLGMEIKHA